MSETGKRRAFVVAALLALQIATVPSFRSADACPRHDDSARFFVPKPNQGALTQISALNASHKKADARLIKEMIETPQAVWLTGGTPKSVRDDVKDIVRAAEHQGAVPVLVAYNLPFRDCAQYSAGGAASVAEYKAWIDGFAAGVGHHKVIVILEPDGLGIIPWYKQFRGLPSEAPTYETCQLGDADPATAADDRFAMVNYAVDALKAGPHTTVYLDGTHSSWLGAGDAAHRLVQAGVAKADGFFLNVSNYQATDHLQKYGPWISKCIWFATQGADWSRGHFDWCASQYYPATPSDFSTWALTDQWYTENVESQTYAGYPGDAGLKGFVIDTSRNGQGPWTSAVSYPDNQDWCNPPTRGLGFAPSTKTGVELNDAFLWIKIPGESDGQCNRGTGGTTDPARGNISDPAAGLWFPDMALELVHNANPPLK
jgi:endoglucanase